MKIPLSDRLQACCSFVLPGARVADVGCDHGYLGIYLLTKGIASYVIAADINEGPLKSALRNSEKYGTREKMSFYLSDGVKRIPHDFDTLVCAGMGADTMISILSAAPWLKDTQYRLILQCQSKTPLLRQFLHENGWSVQNEVVLRDGRFLYTVMEVTFGNTDAKFSVGEYYFPAVLLEKHTAENVEYYHQVIKKLRISVNGHGTQADPIQVSALEYLENLVDKYPFLKEASQ